MGGGPLILADQVSAPEGKLSGLIQLLETCVTPFSAGPINALLAQGLALIKSCIYPWISLMSRGQESK